MDKLIFQFLLVAGTFLLFSSCQKDNEQLSTIDETIIEEEYPGVDEALWPFFAQFEEEGRQRGLLINLKSSGITAVIQEIDEEHVAGQCNFSSNRPNHIIIDLEFWRASSNLFKEFIIFHEIGHCYLFRGHREDAYANGACVSIMRSGVEDCRDNYNPSNRSIYIDELFLPDNF